MNTLPLENRIAIVTGASAGIGEATVRELVAAGSPVVMNARRQDRLESLVRELGEEDVAAVAGDCADPAVIHKMFEAARKTFGGEKRDADLVVVNAGRGLNGSVVTSDISEWDEMVRTNVLGAAHLIRVAAQRMLQSIGGKTGAAALDAPRDIIVLGSTVGRHISPFSSMYGSTKFAVNSLAEAARRELGPKGIRVTLIEPAFVESEFQGVAGYAQKWFDDVKERIGPVLKPVDVAKTIAWVAQQPPAVHLSDVLIRPTRQDYP